jgi:hypothetical protein
LFDPRPVGDALHVRVTLASILSHLAKKVLAVDQLQRPSPEGSERDPEPLELDVLTLLHEPDHLGWGEAANILETLLDAVECPRPRYHKLILAERRNLAVVNVCDELVRQEIADRRVVKQ